MAGTDHGGEGPSATGGWGSLLFLVGLVAFVASLAAFAADLLTGHTVLRSAAVNAAAALALVGWAAHDTLTDPESAVDSRGGAATTALMLYGLYLALASVVVAATSPWHGQLSLAVVAGGVGIAAVLVGFLGFPRERVLDSAREAGDDGSETDGDAEGLPDESPPESGESRPVQPADGDGPAE